MIENRTQFALRSLQPDVNFSDLCREFGISRKTGYKWRERFLREGASGLPDRSRKPRRSPRGLDEDTLCQIAKLHDRHPDWGPRKIRLVYARGGGPAPSESSFKRVFEKAGWTSKRRRRPRAQSGRVCSGRVAQECNDVWTVDFKGWWRTGDGARCEPLTVRDERSRYILEARPMATNSFDAVKPVFEGLFKAYGMPDAIRSDNGTPFAARSAAMGLSRLSAWWLALGIDLERGRPAKPQDNGAHERMHLDIANEIERRSKGSIEEQHAAMEVWRRTFNEVRPHDALGGRTPAEIYRKSESKYPDKPEDLEYPGMLSRRVSRRGYISLRRQKIAVSTALSGWSVGLDPVDPDRYDLYFAKLKIGQVEVSTASLLQAASGLQEGSATQRKSS